MEQVVLAEPGRFEYVEVNAPEAKPGEVLVRVLQVGVCGSDFHAFAGTHPVYTYPRVLGHELSVEVVAAPSDAPVRPGDRCAVEPYLPCGNCYSCNRGKPNCCERLQVIGVHIDGGMRELFTLPAAALHPSDRLGAEELALVETLGIGAHAVARAGLQKGDSALIVGAGPIGLATATFARLAGDDVHLIERNSQRAEFAREQGWAVTEVFNGQPADAVFDATGHAGAMAESLRFVAPGGRLVFVGLCSDAIAIDDPTLHRREITVMGSRNSARQFPRIIRLLEQGVINVQPWIGARMRLRDVPDQFAQLRQRPDLVKALIAVSD